MTLLIIKVVLLAWLIGSAIYVHLRGKERMSLRRQLTDFSTFLAPFNVFGYIFSGVPNTPFIPTDRFPELKLLRDNWKTIRDEAQKLDEVGCISSGTGLAFKSFYKQDRWRRFFISWYGKSYEEARQYAPKTLEMVNSIPSINGALFVRLNPHKSLNRHRDPFSISLRYHLGLVTPNSEKCRIIVDGQPYHWTDGGDVVFDETYIHEAHNETDSARIVLFCDVQRPMSGPISTFACKVLRKVIGVLTVANNKEGEHRNLINDVLEKYLYPISYFFQNQKKKNRKLYYAVKHLLIIALLAWIIL